MSERAAGLEIRVERSACRGAGECVRRAPHTFSLDAERRARVASSTDDPDALVLEAARSCPHFAIRVRRGDETLA